MNSISQDVPIRDAATVVIRRIISGKPHVLMGQRGKNAVFMPNKFVFPGGSIDEQDEYVQLAKNIQPDLKKFLSYKAYTARPNAILSGAIREVWEEVGLRIIGKSPNSVTKLNNPTQWDSFLSIGYLPDPNGLEFFFRAITPPGRPRRFDARFFICNSDEIHGDLDDFSSASSELSHIQWIDLKTVKELELPFITEIVLAEVAAREKRGRNPAGIPFFDYSKKFSQISFIK